jgi:hypothetical protein
MGLSTRRGVLALEPWWPAWPDWGNIFFLGSDGAMTCAATVLAGVITLGPMQCIGERGLEIVVGKGA